MGGAHAARWAKFKRSLSWSGGNQLKILADSLDPEMAKAARAELARRSVPAQDETPVMAAKMKMNPRVRAALGHAPHVWGDSLTPAAVLRMVAQKSDGGRVGVWSTLVRSLDQAGVRVTDAGMARVLSLLEKQGKIVRSGVGPGEDVRLPQAAPSAATAARERAIRDTFKI